MAISDKLTYLNDTKLQLKDMINYGLDTGEKITSETTFRNYVKSLFDAFIKTMTYPDVLYENLPKVTGTGTNVTLNGTAEAPMRNILRPSAISQETTTGANLQKFNARTSPTYGYTCDETGQVTITGTTTQNAGLGYNIQSSNPMTLEAGTYTLKVIGTIGSNVIIQYRGYQINLDANQEYHFTLSEQVTNFYVGCYVRAGEHNSNYYMTLAQGTTGTTERYTGGQASPNPDYPQDIHVVSGDNSVKIQNKNLFDKDNMQNGFIPSNGDYPTSNPSYPNAKYYLVPLNANDSITISGSTNNFGRVRCINRETNKVIGSVIYATNDYYTTDKDYSSGFSNGTIIAKKDIILAFMVIQGTDTLDTFQIEYGTTATTYEPHQEQSLPLNLGDLEYCKIGNYEDVFFKNVVGSEYYDSTLVEDKWYLKKKIGKLVNNSIGISYNPTYKYYAINPNVTGGSAKTYSATISTHFSNKNDASLRIVGSNGSYLWLWDNNNYFSGASEIRQFMIDNNVGTYYQLATPTFTLLSDTLQTQLENIYKAMSYDGQTNVSQENTDLPFVLSLSAIKDFE